MISICMIFAHNHSYILGVPFGSNMRYGIGAAKVLVDRFTEEIKEKTGLNLEGIVVQKDSFTGNKNQMAMQARPGIILMDPDKELTKDAHNIESDLLHELGHIVQDAVN